MKNNFCLLLFLVTLSFNCPAQFTDRVWCFGDSVKMEFNGGGVNINNPSGIFTEKPASSICDSAGNLLFYVGTYSNQPTLWNSYVGAVFDSNDQIILNGDSLDIEIVGNDGTIILPLAKDDSSFLVVHHRKSQSLSNFYYLWSKVIDSSGVFKVISKNNLLANVSSATKLNAVKHGNGKDWWLVTHTIEADTFYIYLIDSNGIQAPLKQAIGSYYSINFPLPGVNGEMVFSKFGNYLAAVGTEILDVFNFDRCSGQLSNYQNLMTLPFSSPDKVYWSCSFSPNERYFYASDLVGPSQPVINVQHTLQFDMQAASVVSSRCTVFSINSEYVTWQHQLGPDGKIYMARGNPAFPTVVTDTGSTYLAVIENPNDSCPGLIFNLYGQSLGGRRSLASLPNNPNYELGRLEPNGCATAIIENSSSLPPWIVYPNPANEIINIQSNSLGGLTGNLRLISFTGQELFSTNLKGTMKFNIPTAQFFSGLYLFIFESQGKRWNQRVVIE
ncbi:MAG: T9SS type A sorting domain-containing protein [Bacteroidetes bacterium]|nr:T9SS type A sorting domain-containing protein [Bacteroidota bacterium]